MHHHHHDNDSNLFTDVDSTIITYLFLKDVGKRLTPEQRETKHREMVIATVMFIMGAIAILIWGVTSVSLVP